MVINKKAQFPIISFLVIVIALLFVGPIMLKIFNTTRDSVGAGLGNITGSTVAVAGFNKVMNTGINFWDKVLIAVFIFLIITLLISSFLIDTNPIWIILYIVVMFILIIFAPNILESVNKLYDHAQFASEVSSLSFLDNLRIYFVETLVGLFVVTGIIMYGKIKLFASEPGGRPR